jgi:hypothetical protein
MTFPDADQVIAIPVLLVAHPETVAALTCLVVVPFEATVNLRPACSPLFQMLKALIRPNPDHGTVADASVCRAASASRTSRRFWYRRTSTPRRVE